MAQAATVIPLHDRNERRSESFRDLEPDICNLALMARLALREIENVLDGLASADPEREGYDRGMFAVGHLDDMIENLKRRYYEQYEAAQASAAPAIAETATTTAADTDADILQLEEQIFAEKEAIDRLHEEIAANACDAEYKRLLDGMSTEGITPSQKKCKEIWNRAYREHPDSVELWRLRDIVNARHDSQERLIERMWEIPAHTAEGRRSKLMVLLANVMGEKWRVRDEDADWDVLMARKMIIEFIGGEPAEQLCDQFA